MCSVNPNLDEDDSNYLMPIEQLVKSSTICRKCKDADSVIMLQLKFPYCSSCFIEVVSHKFFGCLGKSKLMKPTDKVLVLCSGSQSSSVLLNLIKIGLFERHKKILSQAVVLFIDAGYFLPLSVDERLTVINELKEMVSHFGFKAYYSPLLYSDGCLKDFDDLCWCSIEYLEKNNLKQLVEAIKTSSAKEDMLVKMRCSTAIQVARELECNKIFTGETNDHTAARILTNIALGRGDQLPLDIGFADSRYKDVLILRPLREWSKKEIAFYRHLFNLPFVTYIKGGSMKSKDDSIQKLTENFIAELQVSFPSTVCMVVGTGNKLGTKQESQLSEEEDTCSLCQGKMNYVEDEMSAIFATKISRLISNLGPKGFDSNQLSEFSSQNFKASTSCRNEGCTKGCCSNNRNEALTLEGVKDVFCYGCQLILNDMGNLQSLPDVILKNAEHKLKLKAMRQEINDFLL